MSNDDAKGEAVEPTELQQALKFINEQLGIDAVETVNGRKVKYFAYDEVVNSRVGFYLDSHDCRLLAAAFQHVSEILQKAGK